MSFTFTLNSIPVEEPMGWDKASLKIIRNGDLPGLFTEVIADLSFYGNAYAFLKNLYDTTSGCEEVEVEIQGDCGFNFSGLIYLSDVEFDLKRCIASCSIEDNTAGSLISRLKSTSVQINGGLSLDGSSLTNIGIDLDSGGAIGVKKWYGIGELMQYCLDYISNSSIQIVSDFLFTNEYKPRRIQVTVTALGPSGVFSPNWQDIYGQSASAFGNIAGALTSAQIATRMSEILNGQNILFAGGINEANGEWPIYADNNGTNIIEILFFGNQTFNLGSTFPWASVSVVEVESASYGASNVCVTTGSTINGEIEAIFTSFETIFNAFSGWYNLSVEPYVSAGQKYLRIEQEPYFFQQTEIAEVNNYDSILQQKQDVYNFSVLNYGQTSRDENAFLHQEISYVGQSCSTQQVDINSQIQVPIAQFYNSPSTYSAKDLIVAEKWSPSPGVNAPRAYLVSYFDGTSIQSGEYYAASISHPFVAKNYSNRSNSGVTLQGINIPNNNNPKLKSVVSFDAPLSYPQINSIRSNLKGYILHGGVKGWIKELSFEIKTGLTSFQLLTE